MITGPVDTLQRVKAGDIISAYQHNTLQQLLRRRFTGENAFVSGLGIFVRGKTKSSGSAILWCIPWLSLTSQASTSKKVWIKQIKYDQSSDEYKILVTEPIEVQCYPGHKQRDYYALAVDHIGDITDDDQVCKLIRVDDVWHCEPFAKRKRKVIDVLDRIRFSDCELQVD